MRLVTRIVASILAVIVGAGALPVRAVELSPAAGTPAIAAVPLDRTAVLLATAPTPRLLAESRGSRHTSTAKAIATFVPALLHADARSCTHATSESRASADHHPARGRAPPYPNC